jgi:CHAT domain-containing protein/tetratricopeptide (TPR) repeat protein
MLLAILVPLFAADDPTPEQKRLLEKIRASKARVDVLYSRGQYAEAGSLQHEIVRLAEQAYPKQSYPNGHPYLAASLNNLGTLLQVQGEYSRALNYYERALAMNEALYPKMTHPRGHPELATGLNNLGILFQSRGDYAKALSFYRRALAMRKALYPKEKFPAGHPHLAVSLSNLGFLLQAQGEYGQALVYYQRALAIFETLYPKKTYPRGHPDLARMLSNLGGVLQLRGDYAKALAYSQRALTMNETLYPKEEYPHGHPDLVRSLHNLGAVHKLQGEDDKALDFIQRALVMSESLYPNDKYPRGHPELVAYLNNLGAVLQDRGEYARVLDCYQRALTMNESLYPKEKHPRGHPQMVESLHALGTLHLFQGAYAKSTDYLQRALAMKDNLSDAFLAHVSEAEGLNYLAKFPLTRDAYLSASRHLPDTAEDSYTHLWRSKAALAKLLERRQQALLLADPTVRQLGKQLVATRLDLAAVLLAPPGRYKDHAERLHKLARRKEELERDIAAQLPAFGQLQALDRFTPRDLLAKLPDHTVFVDFLRYAFFEYDPKQPGKKGEKRTLCYMAFVLRHGQPVQRVELGEAALIDRAVRRWRKDVVLGEKSNPTAQKLRQLIWQPLVKYVPADTETVFLAPDDALTGLPWAALPGRNKGTVLLEDHALAVVPHGRLLLEQLLPRPAADAHRDLVLAAGAIAYDQKPDDAPPNQTVLVPDRGAARGDKKRIWPYLKGTEAELEQIRVLAGRRDVRLRQGKEASTDQLLRDLPQARWAHLATHGFFADAQFRSVLQVDEKDFARQLRLSGEVFDRNAPGARNPLVLSGLVLAGANRDEKDGGILTAEAITGLPLQKLDLAVLSACETGLGEVAGGEGVFGLQRAFHVAGTRTVIASLWKVDDQATAALMSLFYHKLWRDKKTPLVALREAQLELYRHPERIPKLAKLRGPDLEREVSRPVEKSEPAVKGERAAVKLWAGFTLSGLGR